MKTLLTHEIFKVSGGAEVIEMNHVGNDIIITIPYGDQFTFNNFVCTWTGGDLKKQGEIHNGYQISYSMGADAIAKYIFTPVVKK